MSNDDHTLIYTTAGLAAASVVLSLAALSSDAVSRRLLRPASLQAKRQHTWKYAWQRALLRAVQKQQKEADERAHTTLFTSADEIAEFVSTLLDNDNNTLRLARIAPSYDESDPRGNDEFMVHTDAVNLDQLHVWLYDEASSHVYQLPFEPFVSALAEQYDRTILRTTLCIVADASAGAASNVVCELIKATMKDAVFMIDPIPTWLVCLAVMVRNDDSNTDWPRYLQALVRLEASQCPDTSDTVILTLPQALVPTQLPVLQSAFPDHRHVFAYSGCIDSIQHAQLNRGIEPNPDRFSFDDSIASTTPFLGGQPALYQTKAWIQAMAELPLSEAQVTASWMSSVDAFLQLKADESNNNYLPYVFRLEYVTELRRYYSMASLLQFVTGTKSTTGSARDPRMDAATSWLRDYGERQPETTPLPPTHATTVQNAVFCHKQILLENKTLLDTVQPALHWTLKAAVRAGCSCCGPEEYGEEDEDVAANTMATSTTDAPSSKSKYVDGKMGFAFDPTKFS